MKRNLLVTLAASSLALNAADPQGFVDWPKGVPPADAKTAKFENHSLSTSHRDKDGVAELHAKQTDIFVIQSGEADLVVGGEIPDKKAVEGDGEFRGTSIKNGIRRKLAPGDVIHVPAGMPHQFFVASGKQITYFVVKVDKP